MDETRYEWPADPAKRLRELEEWGVDLSLIDSTLARSPRERIAIMEDRLALIETLRRGTSSDPHLLDSINRKSG